MTTTPETPRGSMKEARIWPPARIWVDVYGLEPGRPRYGYWTEETESTEVYIHIDERDELLAVLRDALHPGSFDHTAPEFWFREYRAWFERVRAVLQRVETP